MVKQYDIFLIDLDPAKEHEMKKTSPCIIISPDELNKFLATVIIAPLTSAEKNYKFRANITFQNKKGAIVLDQLRTVDKSGLIKQIGHLDNSTIVKIKNILKEMLVDE